MITWLRRQLVPAARFFGRVHAPWVVKQVTGEDYERVKLLIKPGDVFVTRSMGHVTNWVIPGYWKHAAMMGPHGSVFCGQKAALNAAKAAEVWLGAQYDYEFSLGNKAFYCAELVYVAYRTVEPQVFGFEPRERLGVLTVTADDLYLAEKWFQKVYDSRDHA
jgi:uncharacterized protein YycO